MNCLLADGRTSRCLWSGLWLRRALLWRLSLKSCSTSLSLLMWNSSFEMPWFTSPGPIIWGWVHSVGWPYFGVALGKRGFSQIQELFSLFLILFGIFVYLFLCLLFLVYTFVRTVQRRSLLSSQCTSESLPWSRSFFWSVTWSVICVTAWSSSDHLILITRSEANHHPLTSQDLTNLLWKKFPIWKEEEWCGSGMLFYIFHTFLIHVCQQKALDSTSTDIRPYNIFD